MLIGQEVSSDEAVPQCIEASKLKNIRGLVSLPTGMIVVMATGACHLKLPLSPNLFPHIHLYMDLVHI